MSWQFVDLSSVGFSSADLKRIPSAHAAFLVASSFACNEVNLLQRVFQLALNSRKLAGREAAVQTTSYSFALILSRQLSAKLVEYHKLVTDYLARATRSEGSSGSRFLGRYAPRVEQFAKSKEFAFAKRLRNKLTNHYVLSEVESLLEGMPTDTFTIWLHEKEGNTFYQLGEEIAMIGFLSAGGDVKGQLEAWQDWILMASRIAVHLHNRVANGILGEYFPEKRATGFRLVVEDQLVGDLQSSALPLFWDFDHAVER